MPGLSNGGSWGSRPRLNARAPKSNSRVRVFGFSAPGPRLTSSAAVSHAAKFAVSADNQSTLQRNVASHIMDVRLRSEHSFAKLSSPCGPSRLNVWSRSTPEGSSFHHLSRSLPRPFQGQVPQRSHFPTLATSLSECFTMIAISASRYLAALALDWHELLLIWVHGMSWAHFP